MEITSSSDLKKIIEKYPLIKGYITHGFEPIKKTSKQILGYCVFCGKKKMYVSLKEGLWFCQRGCNNNGGSYYYFLAELCDYYKLKLKSKKLTALSEERKIPKEILFNFNVAYNKLTKEYLIPEYYNDKIIDVKRYKKGDNFKYFYSSPNTKKNIWMGFEKEIKENVIICEGEWDFFVLSHVLKNKYTIIMLPGANSYKEEYNEMLTNKNIHVFLDNDKPKIKKHGKDVGAATNGEAKIYTNLVHYAKTLKFKHWIKKKNGYDVRDLWIDCKQKEKIFRRKLFENCQDVPQRFSLVNKSKHSKIVDIPTYKEVYDVYNKWLTLYDNTVIDIIYGSLFANMLSSDPVWLFVIAKSGFAKSEFLMNLIDIPQAYAVSSLTPNALISGFNAKDGEDPSLLPRLDGKTLVVKDYTTILSGDPKAVGDVFSIFRDAYDGTAVRATGIGEKRISSKFGILAGVTPIIYKFVEENTAYGERFLNFHINDNLSLKDEIKVMVSAMSNSGLESNMRKELKDIGYRIMRKPIKTLPVVTLKQMEKIAYAAKWLSIFRSAPQRDSYRKNEVTNRVLNEIGTRSSKQILGLLRGIAIFKNRDYVSDQDFKIMRQVLLSSANVNYRIIYDYILKKGVNKSISNKIAIGLLNLGGATSERILEDMCLSKILKDDPNIDNKRLTNKHYVLNDEVKLLTEKVFKKKKTKIIKQRFYHE